MEVRRLFFVIFGIVLLVAIANTISIAYFGSSIPGVVLTGKGVTGIIQLFVQADAKIVTIHSPQNITYNFDVGDPYNISLNTTANFSVEEWQYSLYDWRHGAWVYENITFTPNSSVAAVRWLNELTVLAKETAGDWYSSSVVFTVEVPNSAPILNNISNQIYVCETESLSYNFNATDADEDTLISDISPKNPFFTQSVGTSGFNVSLFRIFSGTLEKSHIGTYAETITVDDDFSASCCVDSTNTNITVIEINNAPTMIGLGAQTVWTVGENATFYHQMNISDTEDGTANSGNFTFNLSFAGNENLFTISATGAMNYTPSSDDVGVYALEVCANDTALPSPHQNISLCSPNGADSITVCDSFTLTVTNSNRAPEITNYTPNETAFSMSGGDSQTFYVEVTDADGTVPDIDWYIDGVLQEHNENVSNDTYTLTSSCGSSEDRVVLVVTTDGLANASQQWNVTVTKTDCGTSSGGGGGGGGGSPDYYCRELWACDDWQPCINVFSAYSSAELLQSEYTEMRERCFQNGLGEDTCGFQKRVCSDVHECNNTVARVIEPTEQQICEFVESAGCSDGIQNCHDGSCEVKIDCGGPCKACPTCSDGRKNQGEEGIDCGGPCATQCVVEVPAGAINISIIILIILLILALSIIIWRFLDIIFRRGSRLKGKGISGVRGRFK